MILLLALLLLFATPVQAQTILRFTGAEDGTIVGTEINGWCAGLTGLSTIDTTTKKTGYGSYKLKSTSATHNECAAFDVTGSPTTMFARFQFQYLTADGPASSFPHSIAYGFRAVGSHPHICIFITSAFKLAWGNASCTVAVATGTTVLTASTWYKIDAKMVLSTTVGGVELKINDVVEFTSLGSNTGSSTFTALGLGPGDPVVINAADFFDDIMVCTGSYCPPGRVVARQGTSGTPTYNDWTKNSCTGGTIDGCWSNTPFSTASNATSSTASQAQTMLVAPFNTTQTGHGVEVIPPGSTINGCKTVFYGKQATAPAISIRRRFGGTDTDTVISPGTADTFLIDGIYVPTVSQLNSGAEIGVVHGAGTNLATVEDMWEMCDFQAGNIRHRVTQ